MRILNSKDVRECLSMSDAVAAMRHAYRAWSTDRAIAPARLHLHLPGSDAVSLFMPAYVQGDADSGGLPGLVVKVVSVFPHNKEKGMETTPGAVLVLDPNSGRCLAVMDAGALTAIRTGAGSAVATDLLARKDASTLALFGAGAQAATQLEAVALVRRLKTVWIVTRTASRGTALIERLAGKGSIPSDIRLVQSAKEALENADIVCTATTAQAPLFEDTDLKAGAHINAVGSFRPDMAEIPPQTVLRSTLFIDNRETALSEAGDLAPLRDAGKDGAGLLRGEIGELIVGKIAGRQTEPEITLFKSVGMAVQDAVAAAIALQNAEKRDIGQWIEW